MVAERAYGLAIAKNAKSDENERDITMDQRRLARMYALLHDVPHVSSATQ